MYREKKRILTNEIRSLSRWRLSRERKKEKESIHVVYKRKKEGTSGCWSGECFRQTMCATCSRCPGNVRETGREGSSRWRRERPPELLLSQESLAWLGCFWGSCVRVSALLEKKKRERGKKRRVTATSSTFLIYYPPSRVARRWLQEAKRDAFFSSLNRTQLLLRLSVCFSLSFFFRNTNCAKTLSVAPLLEHSVHNRLLFSLQLRLVPYTHKNLITQFPSFKMQLRFSIPFLTDRLV